MAWSPPDERDVVRPSSPRRLMRGRGGEGATTSLPAAWPVKPRSRPGMVSRRSGADRLVVVGAARLVRVPVGSVAVAALLPGPPLPGSAAS